MFMLLFVLAGVIALLAIGAPLLFWLPPCKKNPQFLNSRVWITGGSSGIGKAIAIEVAKLGANVSLFARNKVKLEIAKSEVEKHKLSQEQQVNIYCADVTDKSQISSEFEKAEQCDGFVDVLINCAGMAKAHLFEENSDTFKKMMDLNYFGAVNTTLLVIPKMKEMRSGHVVFVSSMAGQVGVFGYTAYSASKFALRGLAESLVMEVRPYGIGVSLSFPPDTDTPGFDEENKDKPEETRLISSSVALTSPTVVARDIVRGLKHGQFLISSGMDGYLLSILTSGASPASSRLELVIQAFLMGIIRLVMTVYTYEYHKIADNGEKKRGNEAQKNK